MSVFHTAGPMPGAPTRPLASSQAVRTPGPARPRSAATAAEPMPLPQYSLPMILAVWAGAALPMAVMAWVVAPALAGVFAGSSAWPKALCLSLTVGLIWQFVLVLILVRREQGTLRWSVLKEALWLRAPRSPRTGRRGGWLWLLAVPLVVLMYARE